MEWTEDKINLYMKATLDLQTYVDVWSSIVVNEKWERKHAWKIIEKRINEVSGHYRFKTYASFRSMAYKKGIKLILT